MLLFSNGGVPLIHTPTNRRGLDGDVEALYFGVRPIDISGFNDKLTPMSTKDITFWVQGGAPVR